MARFLIIVIVLAVVLTLYALIDCAMADAKRARVLTKPVWIVVVLLLPVVGPLLWIFFGKGIISFGGATAPRSTPDDDPEFLRMLARDLEQDQRIRELDAQLAALDREFRPETPEGDEGDVKRGDEAPGEPRDAGAAASADSDDAAAKPGATGAQAVGDASDETAETPESNGTKKNDDNGSSGA